MKTFRNILTVFFIGLTIDLSAQKLNKDSIDSLIRLYYPTSDNRINRMYIIDVMYVDLDRIDSLINNDNLEIAKLSFLDSRKMNSITWERQTDIVILVSLRSYNSKDKRKDYKNSTKKIKRMSHDLKSSPVLQVDSKIIENDKALKTIKALSLKQIKTINIYKDSVSIDKFGLNGKNGLIEIKTR